MNKKELEKKRQIDIARDSLVVKSNDLVNNVRYDLSVEEQKIVIYLMSKICASDTELKNVSFSLKEYCELAGITCDYNNYEYVKHSIKTLRDKSWWLKDDVGEVLFSWIDYAIIDEKKARVDIALSRSLDSYLLGLKKNFVKYELINVLLLRSKYSIRLYEIFKSKLWLEKWEVSIDEFRDILQLGDKYELFGNIKKSIIEPALKDIEKTDIKVSYKPIKSGRKIDKILFSIKSQNYQICFEDLTTQEIDTLFLDDEIRRDI